MTTETTPEPDIEPVPVEDEPDAPDGDEDNGEEG